MTNVIFGAKRIRGKEEEERQKNTSFWIIKAQWKSLCNNCKKNCSKKELLPIIKGHVL